MADTNGKVTPGYSRLDISEAANRAAEEVQGEVDCCDERITDIINLVVNATLHYLENPDGDLKSVAESCYSETLETILEWIN